jgi:hypothetical protein
VIRLFKLFKFSANSKPINPSTYIDQDTFSSTLEHIKTLVKNRITQQFGLIRREFVTGALVESDVLTTVLKKT